MRDFLIVNKMAPVEAWVRTDLEGKRKKFKNWYEFLNWFDEKHHGVIEMPPNSQEKYTDVLVDTLTDSPRVKKVNYRVEPGEPTGERAKQPVASKGKRNQGVTMDGKPFTSLFKAFSSLGWPDDSKFQKFRKELKAKLELTYEGHKFKIIQE